MDMTRVQQLLSQWHEAHRQQFIRDGLTNLLDSFDQQEKKHIHVGAKYARLDVGGSGAWMLEMETGIVYGIKGYGTPDKKKIVGDINDPSFDGAILFATTLLCARKLIDCVESDKPNLAKEYFVDKAIREAEFV